MRIARLIFGFNGRISRRTYWLCFAGIVTATIVVVLVDELTHIRIPWIRRTAIALSSLAVIPITIKRLHDRDLSWRVPATIVAMQWVAMISTGLFTYWKSGHFGADWIGKGEAIYLTFCAPMIGTFLHLQAPIGGVLAVETVRTLSSNIRALALLELLASVAFVVVGTWFFWQVGLKRGVTGPNRFGEDPLGPS